MKRPSSLLFSCLLALSTTGILPAQDIFNCGGECFPEVRKRSVWAGFGYLNARADEVVFGGPGGKGNNELSHLIWDTDSALTFNVGFDGEINNRWSVFGQGTFSLNADTSFMSDYDWLLPTNDWSDLSVHPATDLNHYVQVDVGLDYKLLEAEKVTFLMRGGFRYTDISYDAYGGSFIYSNTGFRDLTGTFPNRPVISYRQKLPGLYVGPRMNVALGCKLNMRAGALVGLSFNPEARDHHWLTGTLFEDNLKSNAFYGASLGFDYAINSTTMLYIEGSYDMYKQTQGYTEIFSPAGNGVTGAGTVGAELQTMQINAGIKINGWNKELFPNQKCKQSLF